MCKTAEKGGKWNFSREKKVTNEWMFFFSNLTAWALANLSIVSTTELIKTELTISKPFGDGCISLHANDHGSTNSMTINKDLSERRLIKKNLHRTLLHMIECNLYIVAFSLLWFPSCNRMVFCIFSSWPQQKPLLSFKSVGKRLESKWRISLLNNLKFKVRQT